MTKNNESKEKTPVQEKASPAGFFQNLIMSLFKSADPEVENKRKLRVIAKNLSKTKYHNFYRPGSTEMQAPFARLIYEIYRIVAPAQAIFKANQNIKLFQRQIMNYSLSEQQVNLLGHFSEEYLFDTAKKIPLRQLQQQTESDLESFSTGFDAKRAADTENLYRTFMLFRDFCMFDFYFMLKKFDSGLQENVFTETPQFGKVNAEYILDDLKDFMTVAYPLSDDVSWTPLFEMLKATHGTDFVSAANWKKIVAKLKMIQLSGALDMIVRLISKNPDYEAEVKGNRLSIVEPYVDSVQDSARKVLSEIAERQKESKVGNISVQIFGQNTAQNLKNYTESLNAVLEKKGLNRCAYTEPLNYLKTFLLEYVKTDMRQYFDVVVIRGQWDASLSAPMSNAYQDLLNISDRITEFDASLAEDGSIGMKIKTLLPKTAHDAGAENIINRLVGDADDQAKGFILSGTHDFVTIGKTMKQLIEDISKPKPVIVQNWRELEKYSESPLKEFSVSIYKKIYLFVQLVKTYLEDN